MSASPTTCCFIGHRDATPNPELITAVRASARALITIFDTDTFLFGSASGFDRICLSVVTDLKENTRISAAYTSARSSRTLTIFTARSCSGSTTTRCSRRR